MTETPTRHRGTTYLFLFTFAFFVFLSIVNLTIGINLVKNPGSFPSSYWDIRWVFFFASAFALVALLTLLQRRKLLILLTVIASGILAILPVFTIGVGGAYLTLILLLVIAYGAGEFFLRILLGARLPGGLELFVLSVLLGMGFLAILVMIQGMLFAYQTLVTWLGLAGLTLIFVVPKLKRWLAAARTHFSDLRKLWDEDSWFGWSFAIGILAILWVPSWLIALAPANRYDEMTYHLTAPLYYLSQGGIVRFPEGWMHYAEMLYTLALQTAGQPLPRLMHITMGLLSTSLVFLFGRRLVNAKVGMAAAILFLAAPVIGYETATAYIDLFVASYTTAFGFTLLLWWQERNPRWLLVAGVMGGIGLGIKLTAGPMIASSMIALLVALIFTRQVKQNFLWAGAMFGIIVAIALPWLIRDMVWTGDPFYPYGFMFLDRITSSMSADNSNAVLTNSSRWLRLLRYPVDLVINSRQYYHEAPGGFASALSMLAFPLFALFPAYSKKVKTTGVILLAASFMTIGILVLVNNALLRYAIPTLPWFAICAGLNLNGLHSWLADGKRKIGITFLWLVFLVYAFSTRLPLIMRQYDNLPQRFPVNYVLGRESRDAYLSRTLAVYDAFRFIESMPGGPHKVLSIGNEFRLYTNLEIGSIYDTHDARVAVSSAANPAELAQQLEQSGYDTILYNQPEVEFVRWKYVDPNPILEDQEFWNTYCRLIYVRNGIYVYQFQPDAIELTPPINLLKNDGFEEVHSGNDFAEWEEFGAIEKSREAYRGENSVLLHAPLSENGGGDIVQQVPVKAYELYTLGYWLRAEPSAVFLMRIYWLNEKLEVIGEEVQWRNVKEGWDFYTLSFQAPEGANFAEVHASLGNSESAWVDEICFAVGQFCPSNGDQ